MLAAIAHRTLLAVAGILLLTPATADAARYKKGSFTKTTNTTSCPNGPPACTNVVAHGLGETPKALILWTNTKTSEAYSAGFLYGFGVSDGPLSSRSVSLASLDAVGTSDASRRMASKALTIVYGGELLVSEADLVSWDETNFTLSWTTNITNVASVIHYIVIGGGDVSAKVVDWQMPAPGVDAGCSPPTCAKVVDTVGFQPDVVLHAHAGANFTGAFGTSSAHGGLGFGVMTSSGEQWSNAIWIDDAANTSDSVRGQQTDACLYGVFVDTNASTAAMATKEATCSVRSDGFELNFTTSNSFQQGRVFSLALKGVNARAGHFNKTTAAATVSQTIADVGFKPDLVMLTSYQSTAQVGGTPGAHGRFGIGASDGTTEGASTFVDTDAQGTSRVDGVDKTSKIFVKNDNDSPAAAQAEADLTSFFNGGFNLSWTTNDAVATEILYLALGQQSEAKVLSGSYRGDGADDRAITVGFVPDVIIVKGGDMTTPQVAVFRTSTMSGDASKVAIGSTALLANLIQSFTAANGGGFVVGNDDRVNSSSGCPSDCPIYYWTAFKSGSGKMAVGSYVGNGTAGSAVSSLEFSPELVFIMSAGAHEAIHRSSATTSAFNFNDSAGDATSVSSLDADGFSVGTETRVNNAGTTYHYVAWNEVPGEMEVGSYAGEASLPAGQTITGVGFESEYLIIKRQASGGVTQARPASLAQSASDGSLFFYEWGYGWGRISSVNSDGFAVSDQWNVNGTGGTFSYYAWKRTSQSVIVSGDYTGNGTDNHVVDQLGFVPDVVIIKGNTAQNAVIRTSTMSGDASKPMVGASGMTANLVKSLEGNFGGGFTLGTDARVNQNLITYYFTAFKAAAGTMRVGTYSGDGNAGGQAITGIGFSPELVFILSEGTGVAIHRSSATTGAPAGSTNEAYDFLTGGGDATWVTSLDEDGFTLGSNHANVNANGTVYHYVAWNAIPGEMAVGGYTGSGGDNRNLTGIGFEPEYVLIKSSESGNYASHHPGSLGRSTDEAMYFDVQTNTNPGNRIQALISDGFQVGNDAAVNGTAGTAFYSYYAWRRPYVSALTAVRLTGFTATRYARGVHVSWKTGYEIDNLGFHVYRELNGERTRVTRSMVAGSGLMAGQGTAVQAEQRYAIWDLDGSALDSSVVYWLEDLDFNGTSTFNGPIVPIAGNIENMPEEAASASVRDLSLRSKRRGRVYVSKGARLAGSGATEPAAADAVQMQRALAAQGSIKIGVVASGWYRVSQPDLVAAGLDRNVDPHTIRLFTEGVEQAIHVSGSQDRRFDESDSIEFFATGIDTPHTDARIYWLTAGSRAGRRIMVHGAPARGTRGAASSSFDFTVQQKERSIYFAALRNGDQENWFGAFISEEPSELTFEVANLDRFGTSAEVEVVLQGVSASADVDQDHRVAIMLNGTDVGEVVFDGQSQGTGTFAIAAGTLVEGTNTLTISARGGEEDYSLVDVVRLRYPHTYRADADVLRFTATGPGAISIAGFSNSAVRVVDITDPMAPEELRGTTALEAGLWTVTVRVPNTGTRTLFAFTPSTAAVPTFLRPNRPSSLHAAINRADYVAVTHGDFAGSVTALLDRRKQNGLSSVEIDIEDVYDEFSFGIKTPQALKDFITHAGRTWQTAPRFLLLVGDATLDPRDYAGFGDADFVPTRQIAMVQVALETASDDWFADSDDDGLPEAAVGRLPVRSREHAQSMIAKILDYEDSQPDQWTREVLLVAGENDEAGDFEQATTELQRTVPATHTVQRVLSGESGAESARLQLLEAVNRGQLIVNYIGHGSVRVWGREALLSNDDVAVEWHNAGRLPLVVAMNCLNGFFHGIYDEESLAETLLRTAGSGAVATWASSGVTDSSIQAKVNQQLFKLLFNDPSLTIGQAVTAAKRVVSDRDLRRSWIYFGDPALRLKSVTAPVSDSSALQQPFVLPVLASEVFVDTEALATVSMPAAPPAVLADWNGDGADDVFLYSAASWQAVLGFASGERVQAGNWNAAYEVYPADLNGDRVQDLVLVDRSTGVMLHGINDGTGRFVYREGLLGADWQVHVADLNGDGLDDLLLTIADRGFWYTLVNDGQGHFAYRAGSWTPATSVTTGDFNGEGRTDAFLYDVTTGNWTIAFSDTTGGFTYASGQSVAGLTVRRARLNNDKRADLLAYEPRSGEWAEWTSTSTGLLSAQSGVWRAGLTVLTMPSKERDDVLLYDSASGEWTFRTTEKGTTKVLEGRWQPHLSIATGDLNGDGLADLLLYDAVSGAWKRGIRNTAGSFDFTSGDWAAGWSLASRP